MNKFSDLTRRTTISQDVCQVVFLNNFFDYQPCTDSEAAASLCPASCLRNIFIREIFKIILIVRCCPFCLAKHSLGQKGNAPLQLTSFVAVRFALPSIAWGKKATLQLLCSPQLCWGINILSSFIPCKNFFEKLPCI